MKIKKNHLSKQEELDLLIEYQKTQDKKIADKLLSAHMGFITQVAYKFNKSHLPIEDLIQEGCMGFIRALNKFKPEHNCRFNTYSIHWIKAYIFIYIYKNSFDVKPNRSSPMINLYFKLNKMKQSIKSNNPDLSTDEILNEISDTLDVDFSQVLDVDNMLKDSENVYASYLPSKELTPEEHCLRNEFPKIVTNKLMKINLFDREIEVLHDKFLNAQELGLIGLSKKFGVTRQRMAQIKDSGYKKIREKYTAQTFLD